MILFLLSTLYAQEPAPDDEGTPTSSEEGSESKSEGQDERAATEEGVEQEEKSDSSEESSEETPEKEQVEVPQEEQVEAPEPEQQGAESSEEEIEIQDLPTPTDEPLEFVETESKPIPKNGVITLKNGDVLHGPIIDNGDGVRIDVGGNEDIHVPESSILTLSYPKGKFMQEDLGYARYFYSPTAMPMKPKTGYISQKELLFSAVAYSPVQDVSFLVGTSVPLTLMSFVYGDISSLLGIAGFRYGTKVYEDFYVGGGIEAFFIADTSISLPFINASYGDAEQHVTIGAGVGLTDFNIEQTEVAPVFLSAYKRITPSIAFITENWVLTSPSYDYVATGLMVPDCIYEYEYDCYEYEARYDWSQLSVDTVASSLGIRFISKKFTTDLALINVFSNYGDYVPIPWLDVSWYFGDDAQ